ncbi:hypothetical protein KIH77_02020 [Bifidobacterium sp. 82T24]|uniref:hypothetical protein n=1 Tax=Bifidobacterium pluvialisilvae TaxID=2834436 RepID=UPI001C59779E|nr:hypothetical protein [Bifidobacterium pluvialisilvae]MBW3087520.1 hypothetical protein [Bifidobacterium pluvialisilvae]
MVMAVLAAAAGGFLWRRSQTGGSVLNCSHQGTSVTAKDYCYGGFTPLEPSGERLSETQAGPYFTKAVADTFAADDAVRLAAAAGDTKAVNAAAEKARDAANHAAETLASRTWPGSVTKAMRMVIVEYQARATIYENLTKNSNHEAIDYMAFDQFKDSGAQDLVRATLELDPEPAPALPVAVTAVRDAGDCTAYVMKNGKAVQATRRCVDFTVTNRTKSAISTILLKFNLLGADGGIRRTNLTAISSSLAEDSDNPATIASGASVTVRATLNPKTVESGDRIALTQWSITDTRNDIHMDDITAAQAAASAAVGDFRFR